MLSSLCAKPVRRSSRSVSVLTRLKNGGKRSDMEYTGQNGSGSDAVLTENISQDEEAYRRSLKGDAKAAEMLVERYGDALTFYVNGYIHDMHEAEDIMIEAFAQMFAKERPVTRKGSFRAYIYKTARNLALRHKRRSRIFVSIDELTFEIPHSDTADSRIMENEQKTGLYRAISQLKAEYREALYLVYLQDMSYKEAGVIMHKSESQITKLIYRGKQRLRTILENEGFRYEND